jgi:Ca2+-binding EF-hand superfamily protein
LKRNTVSTPRLCGEVDLISYPFGVDVKASSAVSHMAPSAGITFDRFVRACVVVKQLSEAFRRLDTDQDGWIQINYDQFMQTVLTLP